MAKAAAKKKTRGSSKKSATMGTPNLSIENPLLTSSSVPMQETSAPLQPSTVNTTTNPEPQTTAGLSNGLEPRPVTKSLTSVETTASAETTAVLLAKLAAAQGKLFPFYVTLCD